MTRASPCHPRLLEATVSRFQDRRQARARLSTSTRFPTTSAADAGLVEADDRHRPNIPRWNSISFRRRRTLTTQMNRGRAIVDRRVQESFLKGVDRSSSGKVVCCLTAVEDETTRRCARSWLCRTPAGLGAVRALGAAGPSSGSTRTHLDPWFRSSSVRSPLCGDRRLQEFRELSADFLRTLKRAGFGDGEIAAIYGVPEATIRERRIEDKLVPAFKRIDTCAAEFESFTPYMYSTYERGDESNPTNRSKVIILGSGPNRIGQGLEFDYCCCHAAFALRDAGFETVMINCNPEPYRPTTTPGSVVLRATDVRRRHVGDRSRDDRWRRRRVTRAFGGQTPLKLSLALQSLGQILGTLRLHRSRRRSAAFFQLLWTSAFRTRDGTATSRDEARGGPEDRIPVVVGRHMCSADVGWRSCTTWGRSIAT